MFSVIIPAHNEEHVIVRCLAALLEGTDLDDIEVIVACNGCTDRTASVAASISPVVRVVETPVASKAAALNLGDEAARGFPRVFLDADVEMHGPHLAALVGVLEQPDGPLAAVPELRVDLTNYSPVIRSYYKVWTALPYVQGNFVGSGVYAISRQGRARFQRFPAIIADDLFVRGLFPGPGEQLRVRGVFFTIRPPTRARDLVRVMWRRRAGNIEYRQACGRTANIGPGRGRAVLGGLARKPSWWPSLTVYGAITAAGLAGGHWKARFGDLKAWERDERSRRATPPSG